MVWNAFSSKRKPIYLFVRKWSKFLKHCLQRRFHELLRFKQQLRFELKPIYTTQSTQSVQSVQSKLQPIANHLWTEAGWGDKKTPFFAWHWPPCTDHLSSVSQALALSLSGAEAASGQGVSTHTPQLKPSYIVRRCKAWWSGSYIANRARARKNVRIWGLENQNGDQRTKLRP